MTSRERMLAAMRGTIPDRVPAAPDISNYVPVKRTGLPFWDVYFNGAVPLWRAYLEAMDYFGGDYWMASVAGPPLVWEESKTDWRRRDTFDVSMDAMVRHDVVDTPDGELNASTVCFRGDPPSPHEKLIKDLERDWKRFRWLARAMPRGMNVAAWREMAEACARRGAAFGVSVGYPGFQLWQGYTQGSIEPLTYALQDCPQILDEWHDLDVARCVTEMEIMLAADPKPDYILFGGSGTITMASPQLAMKFAIPTLKRCSKMARDASVATMLHSCGKSRALVDLLVEHTSIDLINPLEVSPMGDVDLAEVKRNRGKQITLMGNLHTTDVMLRGRPDFVREKAMQAMRDAGDGGRFVLSTGDQCGRDTPDENLFALIDTAKEFGVYALDRTLPKVRLN